MKKKYKSWFMVYVDKNTGYLKHEVWGLKWRYFWPLPWIKIKSPVFPNYDSLMDWAKENGIEDFDYTYYGDYTRI